MGGACSTYRARRGAYRVLVGKPEGKNHLKDPGVDGTMMLRWNFTKWEGGHELDWSGSGQGQVAGSCKRGNDPLGPIKYGEFFD